MHRRSTELLSDLLAGGICDYKPLSGTQMEQSALRSSRWAGLLSKQKKW